jgi:hypothetical protein
MPKGPKFTTEQLETLKHEAAKSGVIKQAAEKIGMNYQSATHALQRSDDFEELRRTYQEKYIARAWDNIIQIQDALTKKIKTTDLSKQHLTDITKALKDLRQTVENVQVNIYNDNRTVTFSKTNLLDEAYDLVAKEHNMTRETLIDVLVNTTHDPQDEVHS